MTGIKQRRLLMILRCICSILLLFSLVPTQLTFAADTNRLYAASTASTLTVGDSFTVYVRSYSSSAQSNGSASGTLTYQSNLLQIPTSGISTSSSSYSNPSVTPGNGTITFNATRSPDPGGIAEVFAVTFVAKAAGNASVDFSTNSNVDNATTTYIGKTFTINNPPAPPSTPSPTPKTTPKPSTSVAPSTPAPSPSTTPTAVATESEPETTVEDTTGVVTNVLVTPSYTSSTLSWSVNAPNPTTSIVYGQTSGQMDKQGNVQKQADGTFTTTLTGLQPGAVYYFSIQGSGTGKNIGTYSSTIHTSGYPVVVTVTENGIVAQHAQIKIGSNSYTAGSDGKVTFGLAAGKYSGQIVTDTSSLTIDLTVAAKPIPADGSSPESQAFSFNLTSSPLQQGPGTGTTILVFVGVLFGGFALLAIGFLVFVNYRRHQFEGDTVTPHHSSSSVVIEDGYTWQTEASPNAPPMSPTDGLGGTSNETTPISPIPPRSINLTEEEPLDMFEKARQQPYGPTQPTAIETNGTLRSPNVPRSTTL